MKIKELLIRIRFLTYLKAFLLIAFVLVGFIFIGKIIQTDPIIHTFDSIVYESINKGPHFKILDLLITPFNFNFLPWGGTMPSYFYFMLGGFFIYLGIFNRKILGWAILAVLIGSIIDFQITSVHWHYVQRDRPFLTLPNNVDERGQSAWRGWNSFPSGHARETALYATIIASFIPQLRIYMLVFTLFVGFSRIYLGAHFPTDVISGVLIGYLLAKATIILIGELQVLFKVVKGRKNAAKQDPGQIDTQSV